MCRVSSQRVDLVDVDAVVIAPCRRFDGAGTACRIRVDGDGSDRLRRVSHDVNCAEPVQGGARAWDEQNGSG
eukprot:3399661-Prymnesium_polylepis.2